MFNLLKHSFLVVSFAAVVFGCGPEYEDAAEETVGANAESLRVDWRRLPGLARDIGVGANGQAWVIGTNAVPGGFGIYRWNGTSWTVVEGGAVRIAVDPNGIPWVVNSAGNIFRRLGNGWQVLPGLARDIGIGAEGTVYVIGTNPVPGGFGIFRWNGSSWTGIDGGATRISVAPNGSPWIVNSSGAIFRRVGNSWQVVPGAARDIGVSADGTVWVIGTNPVSGGYGIYHFNGQNGWIRVSGGATNISGSGVGGQPWVTNSAGNIYTASFF